MYFTPKINADNSIFQLLIRINQGTTSLKYGESRGRGRGEGLIDLQHMPTNQGCGRFVISLTQIAANVNVFTILFIKYIIVESSMVTFSAIVNN